MSDDVYLLTGSLECGGRASTKVGRLAPGRMTLDAGGRSFLTAVVHNPKNLGCQIFRRAGMLALPSPGS